MVIEEKRKSLLERFEAVERTNCKAKIESLKTVSERYAELEANLRMPHSFKAAEAICELTRSLVLDYIGVPESRSKELGFPPLNEFDSLLASSVAFIEEVSNQTPAGSEEADNLDHYRDNLLFRITSLDIATSGETPERKKELMHAHFSTVEGFRPLLG